MAELGIETQENESPQMLVSRHKVKKLAGKLQ